MKKLSEKLQKLLKYTGCYYFYALILYSVVIWAFGLMVGFDLMTINIIWALTLLFIILSLAYYIVAAPDDKSAFFKKLQEKGLKEAQISCPDLEVYSVPKKTGSCPKLPKDYSAMEFETSFYFLCNDSVTLYTKCARFHIFKDEFKKEKKNFRTVKTKKEACEEIYEFYYYDILYVTYENKKINFHFIDGNSISFDAEKKPAKKVIKALRNRLRLVKERKTTHGFHKSFDVHVNNLDTLQDIFITDNEKRGEDISEVIDTDIENKES